MARTILNVIALVFIALPIYAAHPTQPMSLEDVYTADSPAVVQMMYSPEGGKEPSYVTGTGFLVGRKGYFVTAAHVLEKYQAHSPRLVATIHQRDHNSLGMWFDVIEKDEAHDIALCKINIFAPYSEKERTRKDSVRPASSYHPVTSLRLTRDEIVPGRAIAILGFPLGAWRTPLIQGGNVASADAVLDVVPDYPGGRAQLFIVSVPGNHGNSGGPVIDLKTNEVLGIIVQYVRAPLIQNLSQQSGLMVAVPASLIRALLDKYQVADDPITLKEDLVF